jgi:ketosteroid isomerase-like protein
MSEQSTTPDLDLVELVRRLNAASARRDHDMLLELLTPDVVFRPIATFAEFKECRGREEYRRFVEGWGEAWTGNSGWSVDTIRVHGDAVVALGRFSGRAKASGADVSGGVFVVYRFRDGQIASMENFTDRDAAVRAAEERELAEESATPDSVELVRRTSEAANRRDLDAVLSSFAEDAVFDGRAAGTFFEGRPAIRRFLEDWFGAYEELEVELEEVSDLGNGVVFAVVIQDGRPVGSAGHLRQREGWVFLWVRGLIARLTTSDIDEARAAAERLAESRE